LLYGKFASKAISGWLLHAHEEVHQEISRPLLAAHVKTYVSTPTSTTRVQLHIAPRVLVSRLQRLYIDYAVHRRDVVFWAYDYFDYSS
jgi:hypothetical protein